MYFTIFFVLGLIFGSFASMFSSRLVLNKTILGRSACPVCGQTLCALDLVPVLSYLFLGGKCRYCKSDISGMYPLIEICSGLLYVLMAYIYIDNILVAAIACLTTTFILIATIVDMKLYIIPDEMQILIGICGVFYAFFNNYTLLQTVFTPCLCLCIGLFLYYGSIMALRREGLGFGDVKFIAISGFFITLNALHLFFFLAGFIGIIHGLIWRQLGLGKEFPFFPSLSVAMLCSMIYEKKIVTINLYLQSFL